MGCCCPGLGVVVAFFSAGDPREDDVHEGPDGGLAGGCKILVLFSSIDVSELFSESACDLVVVCLRVREPGYGSHLIENFNSNSRTDVRPVGMAVLLLACWCPETSGGGDDWDEKTRCA